MKTRFWMHAALALGMSTAACALPGRSASDKPSYGKPVPRASVLVANHNFSDITLYAVQSGSRIRLGMVTGLTTRRLPIPRSVALMSDEVRILADPIGGSQTYLSPPVRVQPGQSLDLTLGASLNLSSLAVLNR